MSKRMSNKKVKQMIKSLHEQNGEDVSFEYIDGYGENSLVAWSLCAGDGFSEWVDYRIIYGSPISLTADQLRALK